METMSKRILNLMNSKKLNGNDLAKIANVTPATISRILKDTQTPKIETLLKIAQYFNVTMEFLITGENTICKNCAKANNNTSSEIQLIENYRKMNNTDQEDLLLIAEMKANKEKIIAGRGTLVFDS